MMWYGYSNEDVLDQTSYEMNMQALQEETLREQYDTYTDSYEYKGSWLSRPLSNLIFAVVYA